MSDTHNYRICFDLAGETPRNALIYLLGVFQDPGMQDLPFDWLVIDLATNEEHRIRCTFHELEAEARLAVESYIAPQKTMSGGGRKERHET